MTYVIPPPQILDVQFPPQILKDTQLNITVPFTSLICPDGCDIVTFKCRTGGADCPIPVLVPPITSILTTSKTTTGWLMTVAKSLLVFDTYYDFVIVVTSRQGKISTKTV